jgi:N-acetyl sugar amidotransferase
MNRCKLCVIPDTRPDTEFVDGICSACHTAKKTVDVDWDARKQDLIRLIDQHRGREFDCIVPSSGGKDSTWQVLQLLELGARPLVVTATTCHLTPIGRANIDNLARDATTIEISPNKDVRATLNRLGLKMVGDISWPEHVSIFTIPFKISAQLGIPLVFYGENPQAAYGGPPGSDEERAMTRRWVSEFGGFLGLRPSDLVGIEGLTERGLSDYMLPAGMGEKVEAYFLGQFLPWDSYRNAEVAMAHGMQAMRPAPCNLWDWENLDNAQTGIHDHMMYRKFGFGRLAAQASVAIRTGRLQRDQAVSMVHRWDGVFPTVYAGVHVEEVLDRIGMTVDELRGVTDEFTNWSMFPGGNLPDTMP